jgi:nicotinamidase/pyrazinamidase
MKETAKHALIIVDVQNAFCSGGSLPVPGGEDVVPVINSLISCGYYDVIVASQDWHPENHGSFASSHGKQPFEMGELQGLPQILWPDHCVQGTSDAEFHPLLDLSKVDYIQRKGQNPRVDSYSAFRDNSMEARTGLDLWLSEQNIVKIDVCGLATDFCVKSTAVDAVTMVKGPVIVRFIDDGSRGITSQGVLAAKNEMKAHGIAWINSADVLESARTRCG